MLHFFLLESKNYQCTFFNNHFSGCTMHSPFIFRNFYCYPLLKVWTFFKCFAIVSLFLLSGSWAPYLTIKWIFHIFWNCFAHFYFDLIIAFLTFLVCSEFNYCLLQSLPPSPCWFVCCLSHHFYFIFLCLKNQTFSYNIDLQSVIYVRCSATM